jgi:hypothetical protein
VDSPHPFLDTIHSLRTAECIMLYNKKPLMEVDSDGIVSLFLEEEYQNEALHFPFLAPAYDPDAAMWAAKLVYHAAILNIDRTDIVKVIWHLLTPYPNEITPSAMLSVDITLRFVTEMLPELKLIDPEDTIIQILEHIIAAFPYTCVGYTFTHSMDIAVEKVLENECMRQMMLNRIVERKDLNLANHPLIRPMISEQMGDYGSQYWKIFNVK